MARRTASIVGRRTGLSVAVALMVFATGPDSARVTADGLRESSTLASQPAAGGLGGDGRLVKFESLSDLSAGESCLVPAEVQRTALRDMRARAAGAGAAVASTEKPIRQIRDKYPSFAAVAVDPQRNEVVLTDENLFQVLVYNRTENTPAGVAASRPLRVISGEKTEIEFQSGVYVDPETGEIYAANNDTRDKLVIFGRGANGDVAPVRAIGTPHGTFGVAVDHVNQEVLLTVQHDSGVVVYRKQANGGEAPIRSIQGSRTGLADPHGIALDPRDGIIFVANYGSTHQVDGTLDPRSGVPSEGTGQGKANWPLGREYSVPGSGTIGAASITVYKRDARGNVPPVRVITGAKTQLNWPTGLAFDPDRRELFVANDMGPSILVFDANASGDVAPKRVLKGADTQLANPTGVFVDAKNGELWVANFGGHSATVYAIDAGGNARPKRVIRSAPPGEPSLMIGNPGAVAYDSKREQLLVPN